MSSPTSTKRTFMNLSANVERHDSISDTVVVDSALKVVEQPVERSASRRSSSMSGGRPLDLVAPVETFEQGKRA